MNESERREPQELVNLSDDFINMDETEFFDKVDGLKTVKEIIVKAPVEIMVATPVFEARFKKFMHEPALNQKRKFIIQATGAQLEQYKAQLKEKGITAEWEIQG